MSNPGKTLRSLASIPFCFSTFIFHSSPQLTLSRKIGDMLLDKCPRIGYRPRPRVAPCRATLASPTTNLSCLLAVAGQSPRGDGGGGAFGSGHGSPRSGRLGGRRRRFRRWRCRIRGEPPDQWWRGPDPVEVLCCCGAVGVVVGRADSRALAADLSVSWPAGCVPSLAAPDPRVVLPDPAWERLSVEVLAPAASSGGGLGACRGGGGIGGRVAASSGLKRGRRRSAGKWWMSASSLPCSGGTWWPVSLLHSLWLAATLALPSAVVCSAAGENLAPFCRCQRQRRSRTSLPS